MYITHHLFCVLLPQFNFAFQSFKLFNKLFLSHYRSFFLIYFLRVVFPIKRVILVSVLFYEFRFLLLFYFGHSASRVSRYDKGHTFIFLSYLYVSSISGLEVLCYYYYYCPLGSSLNDRSLIVSRK